jgi:hypothetical protein
MDFDNARRILGIPGAPWAEAGPGSLDLRSRSVSGGAPRGAAKQHTPTRVPGGGISLACALRCYRWIPHNSGFGFLDRPPAKEAHRVRVQIGVRFQRRGFRSPIRARSRESESKEEPDLIWTQESESKGESDLLWTQESNGLQSPNPKPNGLRALPCPGTAAVMGRAELVPLPYLPPPRLLPSGYLPVWEWAGNWLPAHRAPRNPSFGFFRDSREQVRSH